MFTGKSNSLDRHGFSASKNYQFRLSWHIHKHFIDCCNHLFHPSDIAVKLSVSFLKKLFLIFFFSDLVGNIITTITICLIVSQAANLVRIFTEFSSHVSFMVADIILYVSLLGAFFWLNSLGYYIWRTFR